MIGYLITGHGQFAPGLKGALEMIAGPQENFESVAFEETQSIEELGTNIGDAIDRLLAECDEVVIFADLLGGSPFRAAMLNTVGKENVRVVVGVNLALLIEAVGLRMADLPMNDLIPMVINTGKDNLQLGELVARSDDDLDEEDGI